ncbi:hypothetical protein CLOP_g10009, partial [Closterium sp. NIES-67]
LPASSPVTGSLLEVVSVVQPDPKLTQVGTYTPPVTLASPPSTGTAAGAAAGAAAGSAPQQQQGQYVQASVQVPSCGGQQGSINANNMTVSDMAAATLMNGDKPICTAPMDVDAQKQGGQGAANRVIALQAESGAGKEVGPPVGVSRGCNEELVIVDGKDAGRLVSGAGAKMGQLALMHFRASPNCVLPSPFHGSESGSGAQSPVDISPLGPVPVATLNEAAKHE